MNIKAKTFCSFAGAVAGILFAAGALCGKDVEGVKPAAGRKTKPTTSAPASSDGSVAVAAARARAKLLHDVYSSTLEVMHHHYFRAEGAVLPARAMEDVFADMAQLTKDKARWIAVNTEAMSIQHEPKTAFEKKAATELSAGKKEYELVENGVYQRAGVIPLRSSCVSCHAKHFSAPPKSPRFAGLVISISLNEEKK